MGFVIHLIRQCAVLHSISVALMKNGGPLDHLNCPSLPHLYNLKKIVYERHTYFCTWLWWADTSIPHSYLENLAQSPPACVDRSHYPDDIFSQTESPWQEVDIFLLKHNYVRFLKGKQNVNMHENVWLGYVKHLLLCFVFSDLYNKNVKKLYS